MRIGVPSERAICDRLRGALRGVGADAGVERLAVADRGVERADRLLQRRLGVEAMRVEDVDVVQAHALQALVEARGEVLARAPLAVRTGPHVVAGLGRDDQLVAVGLEVLGEDAAEVRFSRAVGRAVVVREVDVGDAEVERAADDRALVLDRRVVAETVPQPEADRGELDAAAPAAAVGHRVVAIFSGDVSHGGIVTIVRPGASPPRPCTSPRGLGTACSGRERP